MVYVVQPTTKLLFGAVLREVAVQDFLGAMVEHHRDTALHSERVGLYTLDIYVRQHMTMKNGMIIINQDTIEEAKRWGCAGVYHDAGKLLIAREILAKPTKLDPAERAKMDRHPHLGLDILEDYTRDEATHRAAVGHHEYKAMGSYPRLRRRTEDELVEAVAIADFYDALANVRGYKPAFPKSDIVRIMHEEFNGSQQHLDELLQRAA